MMVMDHDAHQGMDHSGDHTMDFSGMDSSGIDPASMASHDMSDNCCGDDSCPMNACASAALLLGPDVRPSNVTISSQETLFFSHYASVNPNLLVRPPIFL